jgi:hypothetical protein
VLTAPAFLSGLSEAEFKVVRERARTALHPTQAHMQAQLGKALGELREGVAATKRALVERCRMTAESDAAHGDATLAVPAA